MDSSLTRAFESLGLGSRMGHADTLRSIGTLNSFLSATPNIADLVRTAQENLRISDAFLSPLRGGIQDILAGSLARQGLASKIITDAFGTTAALQNLAPTSTLSGRYAAMFGAESEMAKTFALTNQWKSSIESVFAEHSMRMVSIAAGMPRFESLASRINLGLLESSTLAAVRSAARPLGLSGLDSVLGRVSMPAPMRGLDLGGLQALSERISHLVAEFPTEETERSSDEQEQFTDEEAAIVQEAAETVSAVVEAPSGEQRERVEQINLAIASLRNLLQQSWRNPVLRFLVMTAWALVLGVASNYIYGYLTAANHAAASASPAPASPSFVVPKIRETVAGLNIPSEIEQTFRIVNRRTVPVFGAEGPAGERLGTLCLGQIVEVKGSAGKWRYVRWVTAGSENPGEGWVRAKLLDKLIP